MSLEKALTSLARFLKQKRFDASQVQSDDDITIEYSETKEPGVIIDTCLLKCFLKTNDVSLMSFVRLTNKAHVKECEDLFFTYKKFNELIEFLKMKKLHRRALETLQK